MKLFPVFASILNSITSKFGSLESNGFPYIFTSVFVPETFIVQSTFFPSQKYGQCFIPTTTALMIYLPPFRLEQ